MKKFFSNISEKIKNWFKCKNEKIAKNYHAIRELYKNRSLKKFGTEEVTGSEAETAIAARIYIEHKYRLESIIAILTARDNNNTISANDLMKFLEECLKVTSSRDTPDVRSMIAKTEEEMRKKIEGQYSRT